MLSLPRFLSSLFVGASLGVASCFPISTIEFVPSKDSLKVIEKEKIFDELTFLNSYISSFTHSCLSVQEISHSLEELNKTAKTGSILSALLFQPLGADGNLQGNLSASTKEQSGIKADKVEITTNRNTSLTNAYISATDESSYIKTNTMTKLDFKDIYLGLNQDVDIKGLLGIDSWIKLDVNFSELKNNFENGQIVPAIEQIVDIAKLKGGGIGGIGGITVSHPSTISQNINVEIGKEKKEPKNIFQGEANEAIKVEILKPVYNSNGKFWVKKIKRCVNEKNYFIYIAYYARFCRRLCG